MLGISLDSLEHLEDSLLLHLCAFQHFLMLYLYVTVWLKTK